MMKETLKEKRNRTQRIRRCWRGRLISRWPSFGTADACLGGPTLRMCRWSFRQALLYVLHFHLAAPENTFILLFLNYENKILSKTHVNPPVNWYGSFSRPPVRCSAASSPACPDKSRKRREEKSYKGQKQPNQPPRSRPLPVLALQQLHRGSQVS